MLSLTRGHPISWSHLLSTINSLDHVFSGVYESDKDSSKTIGQIYQSQEIDSAQLHYLLPGDSKEMRDVLPLLEGLMQYAGHWGAKQVTADLTIDSELFDYFRRAGFSVLAKQRVFQCKSAWETQENLANNWQPLVSRDMKAVRLLHANLVPPIIQPVEPLVRGKMTGLVYYDENDDLKAYADLDYGPIGVAVLPYIYPGSKEGPLDLLGQLIKDLPDLGSRSVYFIARSYQPWIENGLRESPANPGPDQALMVRYLALRQSVRTEFSFGTIENGKPEPTVPITSIRNQSR